LTEAAYPVKALYQTTKTLLSLPGWGPVPHLVMPLPHTAPTAVSIQTRGFLRPQESGFQDAHAAKGSNRA
jgi:hypothetical protein